jgi:glycine oxidase
LDSDILIIGAGVIGLTSAEMLAKNGARVTVLEKSAVGGESSWAGGGILSPLCPWDYPDEVTRLTSRGASLFPAWAKALYEATGIDPEYDPCGMLVAQPVEVARALQWCASHGMRVEQGEAGLFLPEVAQVRNPRLMRALRARVESLGVRIVENCEVRGIVANGNKVNACCTNQGELTAGQYIVAAGAWSRAVLGQYALQLEIKPMRGQMLLYKFDAPPLPYVVLQEDLYLIPRRDGHLLVGSTLEDAGFDKSTTEVARTSLRLRAEAMLPALCGMDIVRHWAGLRPGSPGNIPTIARHPALLNCHINSGHFRYGVTMALASAEILYNEMTGAPQSLDIAPYTRGFGAK